MEDYIIRRKRGKSIFSALFSLIMLGASIYCLFIPIFKEFDQKVTYFIYGAGTLGVIYFGYLAIIKTILSISPESAIVFTEEGMYDFTLPGGGAGFVGWDNIKSTKIYGKRKSQYLGIEIEKPKRIFRQIKKKTYAEIIENLSSGMPALVIDCRTLESSPQSLAEEIEARRSEYNKPLRHIAGKEREKSDIYVRRQGSATLSTGEITNSLETPIDVYNNIDKTQEKIELTNKKDEEIELDALEDADKEIEDILRSLKISDTDEQTDKLDTPKEDLDITSEQEEITKEHPSVEYRDYGLLFPENDGE